jgi:hypothetical protein
MTNKEEEYKPKACYVDSYTPTLLKMGGVALLMGTAVIATVVTGGRSIAISCYTRYDCHNGFWRYSWCGKWWNCRNF